MRLVTATSQSISYMTLHTSSLLNRSTSAVIAFMTLQVYDAVVRVKTLKPYTMSSVEMKQLKLVFCKTVQNSKS